VLWIHHEFEGGVRCIYIYCSFSTCYEVFCIFAHLYMYYICGLWPWGILCCIFLTEATWMTDHTERVKWHWKKRCLIVSSWWQKTHFLQPCQFCFTRLSLVKMTSLCRYHPNTFIHNGIFNFQNLLLLTLSNGISGWINKLYMEATEKLSFSWRFQQNSSCLNYKWIFVKHKSKAFQNKYLS
jgi:hypothetical protein